MIIFDGNNIAIKTFHSVIGHYHKDGIIDKNNIIEEFDFIKKEFTSVYLYEVFDQIMKHNSRRATYGKYVVAFDGRKYSWRKRLYPQYKYDRQKKKEKSEEDRFMSKLSITYLKLFQELLKLTNIKVIDVDYDSRYSIEADDIIATLVKSIDGKHLIVSNDQDFYELLGIDVKQYNPKLNFMLEMPSKRAIKKQQMEWYLLGQKKDNIKNIKYYTELSPHFIDWVNEHPDYDLEINESHLEKIEKDHMYLAEEYALRMYEEDENEIEQGTRKRNRQRSLYKVPSFGVAKVDEFVEDLDTNLDSNHRWRHNYKRNMKLINLANLPSFITKKIIREWESLNSKKKVFNKIKFSKELSRFGSTKLIERIGEL